MGKVSLDVLEAFRPYAPYIKHVELPVVTAPSVAEMQARIDALAIENARLRDRVSDLEAACKTARRVLRRVRLLATRLPEDRRDMPRSCSRVACGPVNVDGDGDGRDVA